MGASDKESVHGQWSGRAAFVLAATGSAVGLGNIWKFPYITGENGGGAFVAVYLFCIAMIGLPILMGEVLIGRRGRRSPIHSIVALAEESGAARLWSVVGAMGVISAFLLLSFYVVIAGWALAYIGNAATGGFTGKSADEIGAMFASFLENPQQLVSWGTLVLAVTAIIVARGVKHGLERTVTYLMPVLVLILVVLVGYGLGTEHFREGAEFLFQPDFSKLTATGALVALGHAFFTLSLAAGTMVAYGAYLPKDVSIGATCVAVVVADTAIALLAGLAIFPIVFEYGLTPSEGPGLIFVTLPIAFGQMPGGLLFGTLFFVMLTFAAVTSSISLLEPAVTALVERLRVTRIKATLIAAFAVWIVSLGTVFSFNLAGEWKFRGLNFFDSVDYLTANILMPLGGLLIAIFTGWIMTESSTRDELSLGEGRVYAAWRFVVRYVAPVLIGIVFLNALGILQLDFLSASVE